MKKVIVFALVMLLPAQSALAFCTWGFPPQGKEFQPLNATEVFISFDNGVQTLVLKPEWQGNAEEFGIIYPTPSKPEVTEGPVNIFRQLDDATNPWIVLPQAVQFLEDDAVETSSDKTVEVIEEKQVAEYSVTVLRATDADDLVEWLADNDYNYSEDDADKVEYYVEQDGFYFVALKVDAEKVDKFPRPMPVDVVFSEESKSNDDVVESKMIAPDWFWGELSPIQISFSTDKPQLPMRTLKSDMPEMVFDLYTLADKAIYIPGVDTIWSNLVDADFLKKVPDLNNYEPKAKWLVRQEVKFDPSQSDEDIFLSQVATDDFTTVTAGKQLRFNPSLLNRKTGIIPGVRGQVVNTDSRGDSFIFNQSLTLGSEGESVRQLQILLNAEGFVVSEAGAGSVGNESTYFGLKTKAALIKYQNFYRADILEPVGLSFGTGYFGPSTIAFINQ